MSPVDGSAEGLTQPAGNIYLNGTLSPAQDLTMVDGFVTSEASWLVEYLSRVEESIRGEGRVSGNKFGWECRYDRIRRLEPGTIPGNGEGLEPGGVERGRDLSPGDVLNEGGVLQPVLGNSRNLGVHSLNEPRKPVDELFRLPDYFVVPVDMLYQGGFFISASRLIQY